MDEIENVSPEASFITNLTFVVGDAVVKALSSI